MNREDDIQDIQEVEELAEFAEEQAQASGEGSACASHPLVAALAAGYARLLMPLAILDSELRFVFRNQAFQGILDRFDYPPRPSFTALFQGALGPQGVVDLLHCVSSEEKRYSWRGRISHKAKHASTEITTVYIYPCFPGAAADEKPVAYVAFLDDITEENQRVLRSMFLSLLEASKLKDNDTGAHIERVNSYSRMISSRLYNDPRFPSVDQDFLDDIGFLAAMHDVGKIGTPDDILNKSGPLTPWEWSIMREHTINGAYILSTYPNPMAKQIALSHHEMWDGNGYPYRLQGEMIPLAARIVSIADVYDALRMKRSYKPAYAHPVALAKIRDWSGSHFDPRLVEIFMELHGEFERIFEANRD